MCAELISKMLRLARWWWRHAAAGWLAFIECDAVCVCCLEPGRSCRQRKCKAVRYKRPEARRGIEH